MLSSLQHRLRILIHYLSLPFLCLLRTVGSALAIMFVPHCARRMFFVTSLYAQLLSIDVRTLSKEQTYRILEDLNREFALCKDPWALALALHFHRTIWRKTAVISVSVHRVRKEELAEFCIGFATSWLRYSNQRMYKDALQLIEISRSDHPLRSIHQPGDPVQEDIAEASFV